MKKYSVNDCYIFDLPKIQDNRGNLTFVEGKNHIPFDIKRIYYLYDVPSGSERGAHAHKDLFQVMIPIAGSFDITLDDGTEMKTFTLNRPNKPLFICPQMWRQLSNFSSGSVCLVLASEIYTEDDYIRDYDSFLNVIKS